jgi:hypothetical protein
VVTDQFFRFSSRIFPSSAEFTLPLLNFIAQPLGKFNATTLPDQKPEQRRARFNKVMARIYGGVNAKEAALARRLLQHPAHPWLSCRLSI